MGFPYKAIAIAPTVLPHQENARARLARCEVPAPGEELDVGTGWIHCKSIPHEHRLPDIRSRVAQCRGRCSNHVHNPIEAGNIVNMMMSMKNYRGTRAAYCLIGLLSIGQCKKSI